jgi:hypothetical protein
MGLRVLAPRGRFASLLSPDVGREDMKRRIFIFACIASMVTAIACAEPFVATFNFAITKDRGGKDTLLIGPENEDIRIGVIGRWFYPTEATLAHRDKWPVGIWTTIGSPPDDPPRYEWRYMLDIRTNETITATETEYYQEHDKEYRPVGSNRIQRVLTLVGSWTTTTATNGVITFNQKNDTAANKAVVGTHPRGGSAPPHR